ncbi:MAG: ankyrin repeat domain-containing protein [Leptospira sp.]|nr:ankyrin repeat domain-containing protein [Leptospira sp.]
MSKRFELLIQLSFVFCGLLSYGSILADETKSLNCKLNDLTCIEKKIKSEEFDINQTDNLGKTIFDYAIEAKNKLILEYCLNSGYLYSGSNVSGTTYLHKLVSQNDLKNTETLLAIGADPNLVDRNGESALDIAKGFGFHSMQILLEKYDAKPLKNTKDQRENTIILYLVYILMSVAVTIWVARTLSKNGIIFLIDAFKDPGLANSINHLLVVGFYLINLGYIAMALKIDLRPGDFVEVIEIISNKIGIVILLLGFMHFFNLSLFGRLRKRTQMKELNSVSLNPTSKIEKKQ